MDKSYSKDDMSKSYTIDERNQIIRNRAEEIIQTGIVGVVDITKILLKEGCKNLDGNPIEWLEVQKIINEYQAGTGKKDTIYEFSLKETPTSETEEQAEQEAESDEDSEVITEPVEEQEMTGNVDDMTEKEQLDHIRDLLSGPSDEDLLDEATILKAELIKKKQSNEELTDIEKSDCDLLNKYIKGKHYLTPTGRSQKKRTSFNEYKLSVLNVKQVDKTVGEITKQIEQFRVQYNDHQAFKKAIALINKSNQNIDKSIKKHVVYNSTESKKIAARIRELARHMYESTGKKIEYLASNGEAYDININGGKILFGKKIKEDINKLPARFIHDEHLNKLLRVRQGRGQNFEVSVDYMS